MEKKLISIKKDSTLEKILSILINEKGSFPLAIDIDKKNKFLKNPLNIEILEVIAKKQELPLEILIDGDPITDQEQEVSETTKEKPDIGLPKLPSIPNPFKVVKIYRVLILIIVFLLIFFGGVFALFYYTPRATVSIFVENEILSKGVDIEASPSAQEINKDGKTIPAQILSFSENVEKTIETTGEKEVGEKAKGTATIYNKTDSDKKFPQGTILYEINAESGDLKYTTLENVEIPARTADITTEVVTYVSGKKDVLVEAEQIGEDYNLSEGEELSVEDYSTNTYIARTNQGITGGSSEIIKIVAQEDLTNAIESAQKDLKFKAFESFESRVSEDQFFSQDAVYLDSSSHNANHQVGEEAENITVEQKVNYKLISFYQSDVKNLMNLLVEEFVPSNFSLSSESQDIGIEEINLDEESKESTLNFVAKFRGLVVPELDKENLKHSLSGKTVNAAQTILDEIPKKIGYEIKISPNLPDSIKRLPFREKNIRIEIVSK